MSRAGSPLSGLRDLVAALRGENGCPWDRKQTPKSMKIYLVEEMYELLDAMDSGEPEAVCEELGDVLFQIFFLARIFEERRDFDIDQVAGANIKKMRGRHPHVFGDEKIKTAEDVRARWHQLKKGESKSGRQRGFLDSVPKSLPALMRAYRVCERTSRVDFHCPAKDLGPQDMDQKWDILKQTLEKKDKQGATRALGDFLFDLAGLAHRAGAHPETALSDATDRFSARFLAMEKRLAQAGKDLEQATSMEMEIAFKQD